MTKAGRALLGVAMGALLTLVLHPASRPLLLNFRQPSKTVQWVESLDPLRGPLPPPTNLVEASLWVQIGCQRIQVHDAPLSPAEQSTLVQICEKAAQKEPQNSFWLQAKSVFLNNMGKLDEALATWVLASRCTAWNDYQTARLLQNRDHLARETGSQQAWQLAYLLYSRSDVTGSMIERYARVALSGADAKAPEGLAVRYATLMNGNLLRSGARSVLLGGHGAAIVELSAYPSNLVRTPSPRRLWTGQTEMLDRMQRLGGEWATRSDRAHKVFRENEGWQVLMASDDLVDSPDFLSFGAIATSSSTIAIAVVAMVGALVWGLSWLVSGRLSEHKAMPFPVVTGITLCLALLGQWLTGDPIAVVTMTLCAAFLSVSTPRVRTLQPEKLGPLFGFLVGVLAVLFGLAVIAYFLGKSVAAGVLMPAIGIPSEYHETSKLLGLAAIFFAMLLVLAPMWGIVLRLGTPHVLTLALRRFGATLAIGGLAGAVILAPVMIYADRELSGILLQLVGNEPLYRFIHQ